MRAGTEDIAAIVGMALALQENIDHLMSNIKYISVLEARLLEVLSAADIEYKRNGINHIPGNISLSFKGFLVRLYFIVWI